MRGQKPEPLTKEEELFLHRLRKLAKDWPDDLWLFANGVHLYVMKRRDGERAVTHIGGGVDPACLVTTLDIPSDGGDW